MTTKLYLAAVEKAQAVLDEFAGYAVDEMTTVDRASYDLATEVLSMAELMDAEWEEQNALAVASEDVDYIGPAKDKLEAANFLVQLNTQHSSTLPQYLMEAVKEASRLTKNVLATAEIENLNSFGIQINATGRIGSGDIKITYRVAMDEYGSKPVEGNDLWLALKEFMRRQGWDNKNQPLMISGF